MDRRQSRQPLNRYLSMVGQKAKNGTEMTSVLNRTENRQSEMNVRYVGEMQSGCRWVDVVVAL